MKVNELLISYEFMFRKENGSMVGDLKPGFGGGMEIRVKGIKLNKEG